VELKAVEDVTDSRLGDDRFGSSPIIMAVLSDSLEPLSKIAPLAGFIAASNLFVSEWQP
jgi:hypothetical protein